MRSSSESNKPMKSSNDLGTLILARIFRICRNPSSNYNPTGTFENVSKWLLILRSLCQFRKYTFVERQKKDLPYINMRIREHACDSNIKISKFKFNCDEIDKSIPNPLPQNLNHFMMIVGKPGSSKTTLLLNLICKRGKMYNKKFDRIYLFSPSLGTIDD